MIKIQIQGLDRLRKKTGSFPSELEKGISDAVKKSAFLVESAAKLVTPVDTGRLRASIRPDYIESMETRIAPHTDYAFYVHEGVGRMKARPFMVWGLRKVEDEIQRSFQKEVDKITKRF